MWNLAISWHHELFHLISQTINTLSSLAFPSALYAEGYEECEATSTPKFAGIGLVFKLILM